MFNQESSNSGLPQAPLTFNIARNALLEEAKSLNTELTETIQSIVLAAKSGPIDFESCILPFAQYENRRLTRSRCIKFHASTSTASSLRDESSQAARLLEEHDIDLTHNADFGTIVHAVWNRREELGTEDKHYIGKLHESFEQGGLIIDDPIKQAQYQAIAKRLKDLQREAIRNHNNDVSGLFFRRKEPEGLPDTVFNRLNQTDAPEEEPKYWLMMEDLDVSAVLTHVVNASTRELVSRTAANRCPQNIPIHREVFVLRDEAARLLGYENHATFRMRDKCLGTLKSLSHCFIKFVDSSERNGTAKSKQYSR